MKKNFRISYNAPVTLTFALICAFVLLIDQTLFDEKLIPALFIVPGNRMAKVSFNWTSALDYIRLFTHVIGHGDWPHFLSNFSFILILGPLMEERYGSSMVALMMVVTALVTGVVNVCFIPSSLMGASGIAFMLILLASISTISKTEIPVSFLFVIAVYISAELISPSDTSISTIAHVSGGVCGSLFGFLVAPKSRKSEKITVTKPKNLSAAKKARLEEIDASSPRNKTAPQKNPDYDDDKTIEIGTIKL